MTDLELLARIIQCEAGGEGEQGMKAVACVVMNRVHVDYGEYGRLEPTIRAVIYQPGQFDCARESIGGRYNAQNRLTNLGFALWYFNPFSATCRQNFPSRVGEFVVRIGNHCFYNPTPAYADT